MSAHPVIASSRSRTPSRTRRLGAGLITGAADDDPSGIATYSQAGALWGYTTLWTVVLTLPFMIGIQMICARVGRVTGRGLAANMRGHLPPTFVFGLVVLLLIANVINLAADIGAMGAAVSLLVGGQAWVYASVLVALSLGLEVFLPFGRYAPILKWLTVSLLAYVATAAIVDVPWKMALTEPWPAWPWSASYFVVVVGIFGTTISPYLFFWQASEEVEEEEQSLTESPLIDAPEQAAASFERIRFDTVFGMTYSNFVAFFIIVTASAVLHSHGITDIRAPADAARALEPLAGRAASLIFALGIVGTGLLAIPVLAGSAAYAVSEAVNVRSSLSEKPGGAKVFYRIIVGAMVLGVVVSCLPLDPLRLLFWAAVINGVIAVPLMIAIMWTASHPGVMGSFTVKGWLRWLGWGATAVMGLAVLGMCVA
ncbi:MAG TPA: divalent metal cation transporter [Dyella sp.]|uniref:NRAMP family divalent metal transporter n=1 Tax=Dyella sp. TaxID=1869338 RepID=UPI002D78434E|nr:divalent metal cation transporter [Dyella sp.]HET6553080.1 divalent metal cation transporter [Dyella sp.]